MYYLYRYNNTNDDIPSHMSLKRDPIISEALSQLQNVISVNLNMWAGFTRRSCLLSAFR